MEYSIEDIRKYANKYSLAVYKAGYGEYIDNYNSIIEIAIYLNKKYHKEWVRAFKDNNNYYHKVKRVRKRILDMLEFPCLFLTLTFTDNSLSILSDETRRKYVRQYLKLFSDDFVANKDFGKKNGREHYHAVIQTNKVDPKFFPYGNVDFERVRYSGDDDIKLSRYLVKLTRHALKDSTKNFRIIYSKKK